RGTPNTSGDCSPCAVDFPIGLSAAGVHSGGRPFGLAGVGQTIRAVVGRSAAARSTTRLRLEPASSGRRLAASLTNFQELDALAATRDRSFSRVVRASSA